ncbi:predicted protein [Naegleria gruberi]|uniref:Predicted protein n=1 Tax=Naegleria gruberi TaxID=5762 RepID=D2UZG4_NAEGR|nr:uncharacterized protein NAEGRDRAFT_56624 [Naegleria gruberi]EFC50143.1 predicted protein [Naegleria gruberi]|eukprot:XP_002682887.1 predicted protein [Naegleria gruberi strain NEG-M]
MNNNNHPPTPTTPNHHHQHSNVSTPQSSISSNSTSSVAYSSTLDQQYEQQSKRFFHHFISTTGTQGSMSHNSSSSSITSTSSTQLNLGVNNNNIENNSEYGNIYLYFHYMSQLDFSQANHLIKNSTNQNSQIVNRNSKYKQIEDEIIGCLRRFIQCETLYYDANYSPNEKQDLHSLYSLLSSNLSLISMNAPYEFTNNNNNNVDSSIYNNHDHQSSDHLLMMMMMMDQNNNSPSMNSNPSANIDYIYYKQVLQPTNGVQKYNLNLIDKEFILSKQLIKDFRVLIQLRLEIIAFYRILSRYKHPPKYDNYVRIINSLKSKYINRINHTFFEKIVQSINMELNTLTSLFECEYNICNYKYKESVFTLWRTKSLFKQWNQLFIARQPSSNTLNPQSNINTPQSSNISIPASSNTITTSSTLSRSLSEDNLLVHHQNDQQQQHQQQQHLQINNEKFHSSSTGNISSNQLNSSSQNLLSNNGINLNNNMNHTNGQTMNNLSRTNLYKWMTMIFGFSQSKFTLIFHDIVNNQSSQMTSNQNNQSMASNMSPTLAVDYIQWIKSFNEIIKPETVCLIYNASHDNLDTSPILETDPEKGYMLRLRNLENPDDITLSGIKLYPCIFHYPQTQDENKISKQTLMYTYWPNILSLIMENSADLEVSEEAFYFSDPKTLTTYYLCQVTPKLYLSTIIVKSNSKDHQIALKFMSQMNSFIRNRKVFNYLTTIIPRSEQSSPSSVIKSKEGANPKETHSNNKKSTFSLFKKK